MNDKPSGEHAWRAVAEWYHAYFTGTVLSTVTRCGTPRAAELVYEVFCRQRNERFLPGLHKLGIAHLPPAVAAAQYHYLSNHIGGVAVQYMYESERKAWIRYCAPRWLWSGTALCAIPSEVSRAMLAGWHAHNGVSLNNLRLGFVCTKQAVDGQSGLEGYYYEYERELQPHERLRFARNEDAPDFVGAAAPTLPTLAWPATRLAKASRNYAMEYMRSTLAVAVNLWGPHEATSLLRLTAKMIGMQFYHQTARALSVPAQPSALAFGQFIAALAHAQGDSCEVGQTAEGVRVTQRGWRLMDGVADAHPCVAQAWNGLLEGALDAHNHRLALHMSSQVGAHGREFDWLIARA
ncbi:hypothetical protein [Verminephrobacter eiseniae]|uniref:Uncharacterized protein n=1 Tax=Verminephrobacter eiseniae (strain EF01-2) TaxID=391735 RepID=A1WMA6_VEREI|nr:hypothetical protein [Verminephrobacter eiseniae]ABM58763.1 conserved hypothetical protein [Verminephrobacter eiseniae EF01-2]MCW5284335.1 hypothetical protein [Verminephrobacter eiseniae]MCW5302041.1 hypothetical protein [Verminephrobacter eiseniae]MCW8179555.1 hypothetical protein [Verminephrobacter eiseniae]MCW8191032.1 hypothetical protein [Verminephrobacter eiseniae]